MSHLSPWTTLLLENGTESVLVEAQMKSVFVGKLRDFRFAIVLIQRPNALQFVLVNGAVPSLADLTFQLLADLFGKNFHNAPWETNRCWSSALATWAWSPRAP